MTDPFSFGEPSTLAMRTGWGSGVVSTWCFWMHPSPVAALKTLLSRGFLALQLMQRCHRCGRNHCHPNGFYEELQVLRCESRSHHSIDVPDILSTWSSTDLCDVAQFATVEAKTTMRVFLH